MLDTPAVIVFIRTNRTTRTAEPGRETGGRDGGDAVQRTRTWMAGGTGRYRRVGGLIDYSAAGIVVVLRIQYL